MRAENFCKLFILSLLNLLCILLSIIFLTSISNIISQVYYSKLSCSSSIQIYYNHYKGIAVIFAFIFCGFFVFIIALIIIIKKDKIDKEANYNRNYQNNQNILNYDNNINNINVNNNNIMIIQGSNSNRNMNLHGLQADLRVNIHEEEKPDFFDESRPIKLTLLYSFGVCHILYLIEIILLAAFLSKSKSLEKTEDCNYIMKTFSNVYRDLVVVAYIFFFIFLIFYIFILILFKKLGKSAQKRLEKLTSSQYCECLNNCLASCCVTCTNCFSSLTDEEREKLNKENAENIQMTNEQRAVEIKKLNDYKVKLSNHNSIYSRRDPSALEISSLNLYSFKNI